MPRISVVVPIHDVENYLATCLQSLARQTVRDLEVIMVDDGSTDGSRALAERFACADRRFHLITQANGGLGSARNTGVRAAGGEFLVFADSDDVVPSDAYERMLGALDASGSDFASGNVQRLTRQGASQAQFLARTFARSRTRTHVSRCRPLLADRTAWNKLWRRSFWDAHGFRFPEGVVHEDIPVTIPAHVVARSVDVLSAPVYQWRVREDGALSITQRRLEHRVLDDRLRAVEWVTEYLALHGSGTLSHWYAASLVADDLRLHLDLLDLADDAYRAMFMTRANALLDGASGRIYAPLPAIERLKWRLVRRERLDELLEVLRFQKRADGGIAPVRRRGRYYGDYPFRTDPALGLPRSTYRLGRRDEDLALIAQLHAVRPDGSKLRVQGHAAINGLPAASGADQRTTITALRSGRWRPLRLRLAGVRLPTVPARRPDLPADRAWSGFEAVLDPDALRRRGRWEAGTWELYAGTCVGLLRRRRARFALASPELIGAVDLPGGADACIRAAVTADGALRVEVRTRWAKLLERRVSGGVLELIGELRADGVPATLDLHRRSDARRHRVAVAVEGGRFRARFALAELRDAPASLEAAAVGGPGAHELWDLSIGGLPVRLPEETGAIAWTAGGHDVALVRTRTGDAALETRRIVTPLVPAAPAVRALITER